MATSLIGGLLKKQYPAGALSVVEVNPARRQHLLETYAIRVYAHAAEVVGTAQCIVLAVKPQTLRQVCLELADAVQSSHPLILSIAAGIRSRDISRWLGGENAVIRAMPNTPALYGYGACGLVANALVTVAQRQQAEAILGATGITLWFDEESALDIVTALSGSGPAYFFRLMESMIRGAVALGLSEPKARLLTLQTALGAAVMAQQSTDDIASLRAKVTSPGGTTERGLKVLDDHDVDGLFKAVLDAARQRSMELADQLAADATQ